MDAELFWAGVLFEARNGDTDGLLTAAAAQGLHLSSVLPTPGGFTARCAAPNYLKLTVFARKRRTRLRILRRRGLFFRLRPLFRRAGLWAGAAIFIPFLLWTQGFVWAVFPTEMMVGQWARAEKILREETGLAPGTHVTESLLAAGEYSLLQSGEFSWASLNFQDGRLVVETAAAKPVPEIAAGSLQGLRARTAGTVVRTELVSGTMLVVPGQTVEPGQGLIGTARSERDGTLIFQPAAGMVQAQFEWVNVQDIPLSVSTKQLTGQSYTKYQLRLLGLSLTLPTWPANPAENSRIVSRHFQPEILGLKLPCLVEETTFYTREEHPLTYTEEQALALARLHSLQALRAEYPDAEQIARKEDRSIADDTLHYTVVYTVIADICG
mgnify:CR=1 FL=1